MSGPRATPLEKLRMENVALRAQVERLREALEAVRQMPRGHTGHFDRTGGSGSGCPVCIEQGEVMDIVRAALEDTTGCPDRCSAHGAPTVRTEAGARWYECGCSHKYGGPASTSSEWDDIVDHAYRRLQLKAVALESRLKAAEAVVECARPYLENYNDEALAAYDALKRDD